MISTWALQRALAARLTGDAALMAMVVGVYDQPPEPRAEPAATMPYIVIGEDEHRVWDTDDRLGLEVMAHIHVWDRRHGGRRDVKRVQDRLHALLHDQALAVAETGEDAGDGAAHVLTTCELTETFRDMDGVSWHGVQRFRLILQATG